MNRIWKMSLLTLMVLPLASMLCLGDVEAKEPDADRNLYKQISIMEKIIDETMVESKYALVRSSHPSRGVYLEELGPVFTLEVGLVDEGYGWSKLSKWLDMENGYSVTHEEDGEEGETVITIQKKKNGKKKNYIEMTDDERYALVKKELIEVIRDYGDTIARANGNEWFTLFATPLGTSWGEKEIHRLILKVQMKEITGFNQGNINEKDFNNRVQILEY